MNREEAIRYILDHYQEIFPFHATFDIKAMREDPKIIEMAEDLKKIKEAKEDYWYG